MLNSPKFDSTVEKSSNQFKYKEKLWLDLFGDDYKPDFDFSSFFKSFIKYFRKHSIFGLGNRSFKFLKTNKEEYSQVVDLVKKNNYKIDINFLESLDNRQKYLLSSIFIDSIGIDNLSREFNMGKSLFLWMSFWYNYRGNNLIDTSGFKDLIVKIRDNFNSFHSLKYIQAFRFIWSHTKIVNVANSFYDVLAEYNLIKSLDSDLKLLNGTHNINLGKDFSLGTFHTGGEFGYGSEIKYGNYSLDKDGNETDINIVGEKVMLNDKGEPISGAYVLDREHELVNADASGIQYLEYLDSPSGIALFHDGKPVACICFYIRNGNEFFINQIQKVVHYEYDRYGRCIGKRYSDVVKDIDWETILFDVVKELAGRYNIKTIVIQGGENNKWINEVWKDFETPYFKFDCLDRRTIPANKGKKHLSVDIAKKIYDVFALSKGFEYDEDGNLIKNLDDNL